MLPAPLWIGKLIALPLDRYAPLDRCASYALLDRYASWPFLDRYASYTLPISVCLLRPCRIGMLATPLLYQYASYAPLDRYASFARLDRNASYAPSGSVWIAVLVAFPGDHCATYARSGSVC